MRKIGEMPVFYYEKIEKGCDAYVGVDRLIIQPKTRCVSHLSKQGL